MRQYFFAYHNFHGQVYPMAWIVEDGITLGGHPQCVSDVIEISKEEWEVLTLSELEGKYPRSAPTPQNQ